MRRPGNPIDTVRYARCVVRIPPPYVETESDVRTAGLYRVGKAPIGRGEMREVYALYLHDHKLGHVVCDGWVTTDAFGPDLEKNLAGLGIWMFDRDLQVTEGEQDAD